MKKIPYLLILTLLVSIGCRDQMIKPVDQINLLGTDYFPLHTGDWWVYKVDSVIYDLQKDRVILDSVHTFIKYVVTDSFRLGEDVKAFKLERSQRSTDTAPWRPMDSWWVSKDDVGAWSNEGNLLFQKLSFPVRKGKKWDGNAHIGTRVSLYVRDDILEQVFDGWEYKYESVDEPESIGGKAYDKVLTVREVDNSEEHPAISYKKARSKYARGVGLVYKNWVLLDDIDQSPDISIPFPERAEEGFFLEQTLIDYHIQP